MFENEICISVVSNQTLENASLEQIISAASENGESDLLISVAVTSWREQTISDKDAVQLLQATHAADPQLFDLSAS